MIEGFWIVQFAGLEGNGGGVVVLLRGQVLGGDNAYTYIGTYQGTNTDFRASVLVQNFDPSVGEVMGVKGDYTLNLTLKVNGDVMEGQGTISSTPGFAMRVKLTRRARLV